jgi:integrase/recombinase XerD
VTLSPNPKFPNVNLTKYVNLGENRWRFCPVVIAGNGRIKPDYVLVAGKAELHREGSYNLDWYENGSRRRRSVGKNALEAYAQQQRHIQLLRNKTLGIEVVKEDKLLVGPTISESCTEFLEEVRQRSRPKTHQQYSVALRYFQECCPDKPVAEVDRSDLLKMLAFMRDEKKLSKRTAWTKLNIVVQWLKANGVTGLVKRGDWPRFVEAEPEAYSAEEIGKFLGECDPYEHTLFEFFWMTGFRDAEVQHVTRADLDLKAQVVRVTEKPKWGFIPKNWEQREVPIPDRLAASLKSHLSRQRGKSLLLFPTSGGLPNYHFLVLCKNVAFRAGLNCGRCEKGDRSCADSACCDNWFLHKFRCTFATMHLQAGVDICTVQKWMGHNNLGSTTRYLQPARGEEVLKKVNATFCKAGPTLVRTGS